MKHIMLADILAAVQLMERNKIPPWKCAQCGKSFYLAGPNGRALDECIIECECGYRVPSDGRGFPFIRWSVGEMRNK
jgi:DNA-directed RNA polymerase subunit RPC12/RpoP